MTGPSVKATETLEKPPAAKPSRSRSIHDDDPKPKLDAICKVLSKSLVISNQNY